MKKVAEQNIFIPDQGMTLETIEGREYIAYYVDIDNAYIILRSRSSGALFAVHGLDICKAGYISWKSRTWI